MRAFTALYAALESQARTARQHRALVEYYRSVSPADAAWATYLLLGRALPRAAGAPALRAAALTASNTPEWLFRISKDAVGDLADTIAAVVPEPTSVTLPSLTTCIETWLAPLRTADPQTQRGRLAEALATLPRQERFVFVKLAGGSLRPVVSRAIVYGAVADVAGVDLAQAMQHLGPGWRPAAAFWDQLRAERTEQRSGARTMADSSSDDERTSPDGEAGSGAERARIRAVLLYVQTAKAVTADLVLECTFGVHGPDGYVVIAKCATAALASAEVHALDRWARSHTLDKFGPVRGVEPLQVFELAIGDVIASSRRKSGLTVRGARIVAWLHGVGADAADAIDAVTALASNQHGRR